MSLRALEFALAKQYHLKVHLLVVLVLLRKNDHHQQMA